jgi:DNA polymerase-1
VQNPPRIAQIRGTFVAREGYCLVEIDYSQAELRSLAALSGDESLLRVYRGDGDLHTDLATFLYPGYAERASSSDPSLRAQAYEERVRCKNVNFGIMYGISAFGLMDQINDSREVAQKMLDGWYEKYEGAATFIRKCRATPRKNQNITTIFGRRKRHGLISRANLNFLQNEAANFPHQSIASDLTLHTAIQCWPTLLEWDVRIVNLIHDSLLLEVPIDKAVQEKTIAYVCDTMRQVPIDWGIDAVPFVPDAEVGDRWGTLEKVA